ncbi:hypothetical protein [Neisseria animalis]|uniref:Uncharacterized protein n=1 Tax=Neisseria animalis TaxID=492 RepID=A0A5P3MU78_NEIAN|nr:hypothetical protein [Neisseria animalis]QEY24615.1 hypothetical protein D0T90_09185 [Neisseria animalis]ROW32973.1 hypothetical protein CGZ60_01540 [Neisseria animalis]
MPSENQTGLFSDGLLRRTSDKVQMPTHHPNLPVVILSLSGGRILPQRQNQHSQQGAQWHAVAAL